MTSELTFSLRSNNDLTTGEFVELAVAAEGAGLDQIWVSDDLFFRSATVMLTVAAGRTDTIRLGTGILNPYTIHPAEMAMFARSLAEVSGGRALLGIAAGAEDFLSWVGIERTRPLSTTREAIAGLRYLLDDRADLRPAGWQADSRMRFGDELQGQIPLYVGAMSPKMLHLSGELADGVLPLLFPPERYGEARALVREGAVSAGRSPDDVDVAACVWCSLGPDRSEARAALARKIAYFGPSFSPHVLDGIGLTADDLMPARDAIDAGRADEALRLLPSDALQLGIAGDADDVVERLGTLIELGARHISFGPPLGPDPMIALDILRTAVIPELRRGTSGRGAGEAVRDDVDLVEAHESP